MDLKKKNEISLLVAVLAYAEGRNEWRIHLRGMAPGQHSSEETWQGWQTVSDPASNLNDAEIEA